MNTYRIDRSYDWNYAHGPCFSGPMPEVPETPLKEFFGVPVRSRFGIAAGLLLNASWIALYGKLGFDLLTYKTVRSGYRACQRMPNWIYIDHDDPLDADRPDEVLVRARRRPSVGERTTSAVSFGMPSKAPEIWQPDARRAKASLALGQALIVSVVASPAAGEGPDSTVNDYARLAAMARDAGADVIEANLSCPNVCTSEGSVYLDPAVSKRVAMAMRDAAGDTPITLKAGLFQEYKALDALLRAVSGHADGIILVNGISRRVVNSDGTPAFGAGREVVGVLGRSIHSPCLANVRHAVETVEREQLGLKIVSVGGVLGVDDAKHYFDAGAYAVMMGAAPMFMPDLAVQFKDRHPEW